MPKYSKADKAEALENLRKWIKPGDTVYTILRHVSRSGMRREIGIMLLPKGKRGEGGPTHPNFAVACVLDLPLARDAVKVDGCGMDMGFSVVYNLGSVLFPKGKIKPCDRCNATGKRTERQTNPEWEKWIDAGSPETDAPPDRFVFAKNVHCSHCDGTGKHRTSGGYLIKHQWI